jgi:hypothetical protein
MSPWHLAGVPMRSADVCFGDKADVVEELIVDLM